MDGRPRAATSTEAPAASQRSYSRSVFSATKPRIFRPSPAKEKPNKVSAALRRPNNPDTQSRKEHPGSAKQIAGLPVDQIQQVLHPNDAQRAALDALNNATTLAAAVLNESCSLTDQPLTPPGRLAAMETRLSGMLKALDTVQPAMAKFYGSLTDEQKARFDRLPPRQG